MYNSTQKISKERICKIPKFAGEVRLEMVIDGKKKRRMYLCGGCRKVNGRILGGHGGGKFFRGGHGGVTRE